MTTHKLYTSMIKEFDKEFVRDTGLMRVIPYSNSELPMADSIKQFLKSQVIKSLDEEIKWLESKKQIPVEIPHHNPYLTGYNTSLQDHISHLLLEKSRINEEE